MDQEQLVLKAVSFLAKLLGNDTEIAVHNMITKELIWLENGSITGRHTGKSEDISTIKILEEIANENSDMLVGYRSMTCNGQPLRSSNLFIRDDDGKLLYVICVNQSLIVYEQLQHNLDAFLQIRPLEDLNLHESTEDTVESLTAKLIFNEIERVRPFSLETKEARLDILKHLDDRGVFEFKRAVPKVCELLGISQATFYNYMREVHEEK